MNELVSIIMPSYNTGNYIKESINSVLAQTYQNWELLIVDDCSVDNSDDIVSSYADKRIQYIKNKNNCGAAVSRNKALKMARGKWIAFLDSDDLWYSEKLEKQILFMKKNNYHFSYTKYEEMNAEGECSGVIISGPKRITNTGMYNFCWPGCLTVMYDREYVGEIQIFDIKKNNDYAMWLRVCKKTDCYLLDDVLAKYRRGRSGSISSHGIKTMIRWHYKLYREAEKQNLFLSVFNTMRNLFFGVCKKCFYVRRGKANDGR